MAALPDYMTNPNAVLGDKDHEWRYGRTPDYKRVNETYEQEKTNPLEEGSLAWLVSNLVKNWEKEASYKLRLDQWRTIDLEKYQFSTNGGPRQTAEEMLKLGTYNALIGESELYSSARSDFSESHKTFKRALRTFSWEVLEVYSGPPKVAFKWRHWGKMTGKFSCTMRNGERLVADPTNEVVELFGVTVAELSDDYKILSLDTYFNPDGMLQDMSKLRKTCPVMAAQDLEKEPEGKYEY